MPTASPNMTASRGVVALMVKKLAIRKRMAIETPTPLSAVISGRPAASRVPRVKMRTMSATTTPRASVTDSVGNSWAKRAPPR